MDTIITSTPMLRAQGIRDSSATEGATPTVDLPDHLPLVFLWAQKARPGRKLVSASNLIALYGSETFEPNSKYATHQTALATIVSGAGNAQMIEPLIPSDSGPKANIRLSLEVAPIGVPIYARDSFGRILRDADGDPIPQTVGEGQSTVSGFTVRWVKTFINTGGPETADDDTFGQGNVVTGNMPGSQSFSQIYPIFEFWADYFGEGGNNEGIRLLAPLSDEDDAPNSDNLSAGKFFTYRLQMITRSNAAASARVVNTLSGQPYMDFSLKPGAVDQLGGNQLYLKNIFTDAYQTIGVPGVEDVYAGIPNIYVYEDNINTLQDMFFQAEKSAMDQLDSEAGSDFSVGAPESDRYKFNLLTFRNSNGAQYRCITQDVSSPQSVILGGSTNLFCEGGEDGTFSDEQFNLLAAEKLNEYADPLSPVTDLALNPISIFYDTGFDVPTKYAACSLLARRKDTAVVLSTHIHGTTMSATQEASLGASLRARLMLHPESTYFGTPVTRALIMARSGEQTELRYPFRLPLTLWLAKRAARLAGAGDGRWDATQLFDRMPGNLVDDFKNLNSTFTPAPTRVSDWMVGLNYPQAFSMKELFFPGLRTVYPEETSVLTSFTSMLVCVSLQKVGAAAWRQFSGATGLTGAELCRDVNQFVLDKVAGKYAGLAKVTPKAFITGGDEKNGFSWTLPIEVQLNNAKTVMTLYVEAKRNTDA